jgi:asparagine synthetase B (glutamine-hydrolysing)
MMREVFVSTSPALWQGYGDAFGAIDGPDHSADGTVALYHCGRIVNGREIARSIDITTDGSRIGEVMAELVRRDPAKALTAPLGSWAFVALNVARGEIHAGRDPFGASPMYVMQHENGHFTLSSGLPRLLSSRESDALDEQALAEYLVLGRVGMTRTLHLSINTLLPGRLYTWRKDCGERWTSSISTPSRQSHETPTDPEQALADAVAAQMGTTGAAACLIDSRPSSLLLASVARRHRPDLRTFALDLGGCDGTGGAAVAAFNAHVIGTRHRTIHVGAPQLSAAAEILVRSRGSPLAAPKGPALTHLWREAAAETELVVSAAGTEDVADNDGAASLEALGALRPSLVSEVLARVSAENSRLRHPEIDVSAASTSAAGVEVCFPYTDESMLCDNVIRGLLRRIQPQARVAASDEFATANTIALTKDAFSAAYDYTARSRHSIVGRWLGTDEQTALAARADQLPPLWYRLAMVGIWEDTLGGGRFHCPT